MNYLFYIEVTAVASGFSCQLWFGGKFLQFLDGKTAATHITASTGLTPKKEADFRRYSETGMGGG